MFGYVQIRKPELRIKDYEVYRGFYCGLCSVLKKNYGILGEISLTYDMTFLIILLTAVYDIPVEKKQERCIMHPAKKHLRLCNEVTEYVAHMNMILTYYHFKDDVEDEHSKKAWIAMNLYRGKKKKAVKKYRQQEKNVIHSLKNLSKLEKEGCREIMKLADCFGELLAGIFLYRVDAFAEYFKTLGFHLGRFIYIMDAYDDMEKDEKKHNFNPLLFWKDRDDFETWVEDLLLGEISDASVAYQKLPCVEYSDILGNIIYAGVWNRFDEKRAKNISKDNISAVQEGKKE